MVADIDGEVAARLETRWQIWTYGEVDGEVAHQRAHEGEVGDDVEDR